MGGVGVMLTRWCLRCEIEGLRYCGKLAFRADALLVVLVAFACALVAFEILERSTVLLCLE